jgi:RNA polymerase nonessential primary-like sigma factor
MDYMIHTGTSLRAETINKMPLMKRRLRWAKKLSYSDIAELAKRAETPEELFEIGLPLVAWTAKATMARAKMVSPTAQFEDLFQAGTLGLLRACRGFNPKNESGASFTTYAYLHIKGQMLDEGVYKNRFFSLPQKVEEALQDKWHPKQKELRDTKGYPRSLSEQIKPPDQPYGRAVFLEDTIRDPAPEPWAKAAEEVTADRVHECLAQISPRQREVLIRLFGIGGGPEETLEGIGKSMGLTKERIRQSKLEGMKSFRRIYNRQPEHVKVSRRKLFEKALCS